MRKLTKGPSPEILVQNAQAWTAELLHALANGLPAEGIRNRYRRNDVRDPLRVECAAKCAYCESEIEHISYLRIEHIVPKAPEPSGTFLWNNMTLSCEKCNNNKGDRIPDGGNFVHPYDDDPPRRFSFLGGFMTYAAGDVAAQNMRNWLKLNRAELIVQRSEVVEKVAAIYEQAVGLPVGSRRQFVELSLSVLISPTARYSRVAECTSNILESEYAAQLDAE